MYYLLNLGSQVAHSSKQVVKIKHVGQKDNAAARLWFIALVLYLLLPFPILMPFKKKSTACLPFPPNHPSAFPISIFFMGSASTYRDPKKKKDGKKKKSAAPPRKIKFNANP